MSHEAIFSKLELEVRSYCRETPNLFTKARGAEVWDVNGERFLRLPLRVRLAELRPQPSLHQRGHSRLHIGRQHRQRPGLPY